MNGTALAFVSLAALGVGGLLYVFLYDSVANDTNRTKRVKSISNRDVKKTSAAAARINDAAKRKKSVQDSLKELEQKQDAKKVKLNLKTMMQQAGMKISVKQFYLFSFLFGLLAAVIALLSSANIYVTAAVFFVATFGISRWFVSFKRKRRFNAFLKEFPTAVDVIVRGVKAGLPLNDCLGIIAKEAKEPVGSEFARIIEAQQMGLPMTEAISKLHENVPLPESNFFSIVISIQQGAGGNLSEALGNLSNVLRDRVKMKAKVQAMSAEAKASGGIIGSLPFIVGSLVYLTTPEYIKILFTHEVGNIILVCAGVWMTIGILVMKKMINFDF